MFDLSKWNHLSFNDIVYKYIDSSVAIYLKRSNKDCLIIDGVGVEIFDALLNKMDYERFINKIIKMYDVSIEEFEEDLRNFILCLIDEKILYLENKPKIEMKSADLESSTNISVVQNYYLKNKLPYKVFLELTYKCNLRCPHCYLGDEKEDIIASIDYTRIKFILKELNELGVVELVITGGEIGLYKNLIDIIKYATSLNMLVTLLTNGTMFTSYQIDEIASMGIHDLRISIYGFEEYHDSFVKRKGSFSKSIETLLSFREKCGIGAATCIVTKDNVNEIEDLDKFLNEKGIPVSYGPIIFPTLYGDQQPTKLRLEDSELKKFMKKYDIHMGGTLCTAGISRFRINPNGEVNPCEMLRHICLGNIYTRSFKEILNGIERSNWIEEFNNYSNDKCKDCEKSDYCINCRGLAYLENGNINESSEYACNVADIQYDIYVRNKES